MKVSQLNPLNNTNFSVVQRLNYLPLDGDVVNNCSHQNNCYLKYIEVWLRCSLRHVETTLLINPVIEDSAPPLDDLSSEESSSDVTSQKSDIQTPTREMASKKNIFNEDEMMDLLTKIENVITNSYSVPISFRLELFLLQARIHRRRFARILLNFQ